jgi:cytochrome c-type biogenesis protein CcmH
VLLWLLIALMTAAAVFAVLYPLGRGAASRSRGVEAGRIYRQQLAELERDVELGRIAAPEAVAARAEVARRLIAAESDAAPPPMGGSLNARRATAVLALVALPVVALALYGALGNPGLAGQPLAARLSAVDADADIDALLAKVERHLAAAPEDGRGWDVVAPVYLRLERPADAAQAYRNAIRLLGSNAARQNGLGEALFIQSQGIVTAEAREAFAAASAADPAAPGPRFFLGLAAEQDGRPKEAAAIWRALLAAAAPNTPWRQMLEEALARVEDASSGPGPVELAAAADMTADERDAMIEGMVANLADRLSREPDDVEGWLRLIRSYAVLGRLDEAGAAAGAALAGVGDPGARARIEALAGELGLDLPTSVQ